SRYMSQFIIGKMHFRLSLHSLRSTFDQIVEMSDEVERMIDSRIQALERQAEEYRKIEDEDFREYRMESLYEDFAVYDREWPHLMRKSQMLSMCSYYEHQLTVFADRFAQINGLEHRVRTLRHRGIHACRNLILKCGISEKVFNQSRWEELAGLYAFRNRIVHAGGDLDEETSIMLPDYTKYFLLPQEHEIPYAKDQIFLRKGAIRDISTLMIDVFSETGSACSKHCER
ncbi:MAG: hypothetical protein ACPGSB_12325, partial [Opitutales bacterium]